MYEVPLAVGVGHVKCFLEHPRAEGQVKEVGFPGIPSEESFACFHLLHEPSFGSIYTFEYWLMKNRLFSFFIDVYFKHFFHQFVAPEDWTTCNA